MQLNYRLPSILPGSFNVPSEARAITLLCDDREAAVALLARALAAGATQSEATPGQLQFLDPDGNTWILITERPR